MAYTESIGEVIAALKDGKWAWRPGWKGHIYLEDMFWYRIPSGVFKGQYVKYTPVICLFAENGTHQPGWTPTQEDLLAEDWEILDPWKHEQKQKTK